jgi:hypothetical protein
MLVRLAVIALLLAMIVRVPDGEATVAEQRARLPPAAECESPVEGKWKAFIFSTATYSWYEYILEIHHDPKDQETLVGMIYVDAWTGTPDNPEPIPCNERIKGKMEAEGSFTNGEVRFTGRNFELTEVVCGNAPGYNPDSFTGKLEPERQEFQSVNNDGGAAVNEPAVFRRIQCFEQDKPNKPEGEVKAPAFYPKKKSGGGC